MADQTFFSEVIKLPFELELIIRLLLSCLAGGIVGFERKRRHKEAGIRTHIMVALAASLFAVCSKYAYFDVLDIPGIGVDASRISSNIATGVCFLGAGMIFVRNKTISGLTTAAGIWAVSGIGLSFGSGLYIIGLSATAIIAVIQYVLHNVFIRIEGISIKEVTIELDDSQNISDKFIEELKKIDSKAFITQVEKKSDEVILLKVLMNYSNNELTDDIWTFMKRYPYVKSIQL